MSKTKKIKPINLEKIVMQKIASDDIKMKPKIYYLLGSFFMGSSFVGISIILIFLTNLILFLIRKHGPMKDVRLQLMLESFPWWIVILTVVGIILGIWILKQYEFSYKKNFIFIIFGFIISIFMAAFLLDYSGINNLWMQKGLMKKFYQQKERNINIYINKQTTSFIDSNLN